MNLSSGYKDGERMPDKFANTGVDGGKNISPPLSWDGAPPETKSYSLSIIDHHPVANNFVHWLVIDIPDTVSSISEGASMSSNMPVPAKELHTSYGQPGYGGPRPPVGTGDHDYEVIAYALNVSQLGLPEAATRDEFEAALAGRVVDSARLTGSYSR